MSKTWHTDARRRVLGGWSAIGKCRYRALLNEDSVFHNQSFIVRAGGGNASIGVINSVNELGRFGQLFDGFGVWGDGAVNLERQYNLVYNLWQDEQKQSPVGRN
jgi:hypothetical protein